MAEKLADESEQDTEKPAKEVFPKFYYTENEDHWERYLIERKMAMKLCRGETKPLVVIYLSYFLHVF